MTQHVGLKMPHLSPRACALLIALLIAPLAPTVSLAAELRCGWFANPSPGNASLYDKDGEWIVAAQGGHQSNGDWPPAFRRGQWVNHGPGSYGYGCACLKVEVDRAAMTVLDILAATARPLATCRRDKALTGIERKLR